MNQEMIDQWNKEVKDASAKEIIAFAFEKIEGPIAMASSLSVEDQLLTAIIAEKKYPCHFFTLDTGRLPQETYDIIEKTEKVFNIRIECMFPDTMAVEDMVKTHGINLFYENTELRKLCCSIRKTEPLLRALKDKSAWITGLRREQSITRISLPIFELDTHTGLIKVNPIADLFEEEVWDEIRKKNIPYNKLQDKGYRSLGCLPCTRSITKNDDFRAGRWWWENPESKECGLHVK